MFERHPSPRSPGRTCFLDHSLALGHLITLIIVFSHSSLADDLTYISPQEVKQEIENREEDISRTKERLNGLLKQEQDLIRELEESKAMAEQIERQLTVRVQLLYRLLREGRGLKYLLGSTSATELMRRLDELRRILSLSFADRRQLSLKISEAESQLREVREGVFSAKAMLSMLEQALAELQERVKGRKYNLHPFSAR